MSNFGVLVSSLLLSLLLLSCASSPEPEYGLKGPTRHGWTVFSGPAPTRVTEIDKNSVERGKKLYGLHCAKCHGDDGKSRGPVAIQLGVVPTDLTKFSKLHKNAYFVYQINKGNEVMPQWEDYLSPNQVKDLSEYVKSMQAKK